MDSPPPPWRDPHFGVHCTKNLDVLHIKIEETLGEGRAHPPRPFPSSLMGVQPVNKSLVGNIKIDKITLR